jgi:hypothetical protein
MVPAPLHPAHQDDGLSGIRRPQLAAVMGSLFYGNKF